MALKPIEILKDTISSVAHRITIGSVISLGSNQYQLNTTNTLYLRTAKKVTINSVDYKVVDFDINVYLTVEAVDGTDVPVTVTFFDIPVPLFLFGNPKMVSAELVKRIKNKNAVSDVWPYLWLVEIANTSGTLDPASAIQRTPSFNIFFLDSNNYENWSIQEHYDLDVYVMSNYIEFVLAILRSRRDIYDADAITFTTTNHVNFGDYIVDEGMNERILNDNVTGVQLQIDLPIINLGCKDIVVTPNCPVITGSPVTNSMNGASLTDAASGTNKAFTITYADLSPVVVTQSSDSATAFSGTVPNATISGAFYYNMPQPTWMTSYNTFDEGWFNANSTYANTVPINGVTQVRDNTDFYKVQFDAEARGHLYRFLGLNGGYYNSDDGLYYDSSDVVSTRALVFEADDYAFDRLTGLGWRTVRSGTQTLVIGIADCEAKTSNGFTDWHMPMAVQYESIIDRSLLLPLYSTDNPVFDIQLNLKACTPYIQSPTTKGWLYLSNSSIDQDRAYSTNDAHGYVRDARGQF